MAWLANRLINIYSTGYTRSLLSTCEIHGAQQMIFLKRNLTFLCWLRVKLSHRCYWAPLKHSSVTYATYLLIAECHGRDIPRKCGWGKATSASQFLPISDQSMRFFSSYCRRNSEFNTIIIHTNCCRMYSMMKLCS